MPITPKTHGDKNLKEKQDLGYLVVSKKIFLTKSPALQGGENVDLRQGACSK